MDLSRRIMLASAAGLGLGGLAISAPLNSSPDKIQQSTETMTDESDLQLKGALNMDERPDISVASGENERLIFGPDDGHLWILNTIMVYCRPVSDTASGQHNIVTRFHDSPAGQFTLFRINGDHDGEDEGWMQLYPAMVGNGELSRGATVSNIQQAVSNHLIESGDGLRFLYRNNTDETFDTSTGNTEIRFSATGLVFEVED